jgi:hypothetical protein
MVCRHDSCGNARVTLRKEKTVKRAKSILFGATMLAIAAAANASAIYSVDDDRDGRADREIVLEQSDSLA